MGALDEREIEMSLPILEPESHRFAHDAMNTTFVLRLTGMSAEEARGMARECCERLDELERKLSRFREESDVFRINHLCAGETLYLSEESYECLRLALEAHVGTGGLFDVTLGARIEHRKSGCGGTPPELAGKLTLHPDAPAITCEEPGREIDLGGIGKGYALDQLQALLTDWGAPGGLLASGASTLLAFGEAEWPIELTGDRQSFPIGLRARAVGASGTGVQGAHIVDPRDCGGEAADLTWKRAWVVAPTAAQADAWSTAVILMSQQELQDFLTRDRVARAVYAERDGAIECFRAYHPG